MLFPSKDGRMNTDIRLSVGFWRHPKTVKLQRRLGLEAVRSLQILWLWAAQSKPSGDLSGLDDEDISIAADWDGDVGVFASALSAIGFLDGESGGYSLHGWQENNGWASSEPTRSEKGRFSKMKDVIPDVAKALEDAGIVRIGKADYEALKNEDTRKVTLERLLKDAQGLPQTMPQGQPQGDLGGTLKATSEDTFKLPPTPTPTPTPTPRPSLLENANSASGDAPRTHDSTQKPAPKPRPVLEGKRLESFNQFWEAYGLKKGRGGAEKAWAAIPTLTDSLVDQICEAARKEAAQRPALEAQGRTPKWAQGWLNERRWEDDYDTAPVQPQTRPAFQPQGQQKTWAEINDEKMKQDCLKGMYKYMDLMGIPQEENNDADEQPRDQWTAEVVDE